MTICQGRVSLVAPGEMVLDKERSNRGRKVRDITGKQFGRLTALYRLDQKQGTSYLWHCRCACGIEKDIPVNALTGGLIRSCGCARREALQNRARDITGKTFGRLTALEPQPIRMQGSVMWKCRCTCGTECLVSYNQLLSGKTASCGCRRKEHEQPPLHYVDGTCIEMISPKSLRKDNTSGCTGVTAIRGGRWQACITFQGKRHYLGTFTNLEKAVDARKKAEARLFGEFLDSYYGVEAVE